jgi:GxxExxY protein
MTENEISRIVVDAAFKIHTSLGPGLYESVYEATMEHELQRRGLSTVRQRGIPVRFEGVHLNLGFRADLIVSQKLIVEVKSISNIAPIHAMHEDVSPTNRTAPRTVDKLQRLPDQRRHSACR